MRDGRFELHSRLVRPMTVTSKKALPVVVLHGGPGIPSDYLKGLEKLEYRSVLFYDQLGCGDSDRPEEEALYSIETMVDDLQEVLRYYNLKRYHVLGQSWGGILAFEHALRLKAESREDELVSMVLANTPASVPLVESEAEALMKAARGDVGSDELAASLFGHRHNCGIQPWPKELVMAYEKTGLIFRGSGALGAWEATPEKLAEAPRVSTLCIRGENDFVTEVGCPYICR